MRSLTKAQKRVLEMNRTVQRMLTVKSLTTAQQIVLKAIEDNPNITLTELKDEIDLIKRRPISDALRELKRRNLIKRIPDLTDMRNVNYVAT